MQTLPNSGYLKQESKSIRQLKYAEKSINGAGILASKYFE